MNKQTDEQAQNAVIWIDELLTTEKKQGNGTLGSELFGFCCLGVGCTILNIPFSSNSASSPELKVETGMREYSDTSDKYEVRLSWLNDTEEYSFKKIGKIMQDNLKVYFKPEVAERIKILFDARNKGLS